jgi:hypothetical protein
MAVAMDNNKAVARQQRQRGGHNNQMKMTFDGGDGGGAFDGSDNGKQQGSGAFHGGGNGQRQGNGATRLGGSNRTRARGGCNVGGQELQRSIGGGTEGWESEANKPNRGRQASVSHSLAFPPIVLWRGIQQPAREQEGYDKRRWLCV